MIRKKNNQKTFNILTNDPSLTGWGYAVVTISGRVLETGCIKTEPNSKKKNLRKTDDRARRISEINKELLGVIKKYRVNFIVSEIPHGSQSAVSAVMIGIVAGMVQTLADTLDLPMEGYSEGEVKKYMLGKRAAMKSEMIDAVCKKLDWEPTGTKYKDEAVADALGVFLTASNESEALQLMRKITTL